MSTIDSITSSTGLAPLERSLSGKVLVIGIFLPHGYEALITEVVEVFAHQRDSHLSEGDNSASLHVHGAERRLPLAFSRGQPALIDGAAGA